MTRLAPFLLHNTEQILAEWETFARSLSQGASMDVEALRDHAREMLDGMARELVTPRTPRELADDAEGRTKLHDDESTAAQGHGAGRAKGGFTIADMVAEFRALRVSVLSLWMGQQREMDTVDLLDMSRFNEEIDQAIAESITRYARDLDQTKDRFIAILGHDLRSPLNAISMSASFLLEEPQLPEPSRGLIARIATSARTMNRMVTDLLDFARTRFEGGIPIEPAPMDLGMVINDVVAEVTASHRDRDVRVETSGDLHGEWDASRLAQALTNLLTNAVQHGSRSSSIVVAAHGAPDDVLFSVHNHGLVIPEEQMDRLFDAMAPRSEDDPRSDDHLGLGLYIVHSIIIAHGGSLEVESVPEEGTTFTARLPRKAPRRRQEGTR